MLIVVEDREEMEEERRRKVWCLRGLCGETRSQRPGIEHFLSVVIQALRQRGATYARWGARTSNEGPMRVHRLVVG